MDTGISVMLRMVIVLEYQRVELMDWVNLIVLNCYTTNRLP